MREALSVLLSIEEGIDVVGQADDGSHTLGPLHGPKPSVVLVDMPRSPLEGVELLRTIRRESPDAKLLMLAAASDEALIFRALKAGAKGCVSKNACVAELRKAIRGVHEGEVWVQRKVLVRCLGADPSAVAGREGATERANGPLATREQEILRLLAAGGTNRDIGQALFISEKTVKSHLNSIFRKLKVRRRVQAALYAVRQGA